MSFSRLANRRLLYVLGLSIGLLLFGYQAWRAFLATQSADYCVNRPLQLGLALLIYMICALLQIAAWHRTMHYVGARIPFAPAIRGYILSFLPRYVPGTIWGYLSRSEWLAQSFQIPYATSSTASLLEVGLQLSTVLSLWLLYSLSSPLRWGVAVVVILLTYVVWYLLPIFLHKVTIVRFQFHGVTQLPVATFLASYTFYLLFWSLHGTALVAISTSFCQSALLPWWGATAAMGAAWTIGFLAFITPTGLGVRELSLSTLLANQTVILGGPAALIAVLARGLLIVAEFIMILAVLPGLLQRRNNR